MLQIVAGIGRQNAIITISTRLASRTYMLRSTAHGTIRVQPGLKPWRAITLCWRPNRATSPRSIAAATASAASAPPRSTVTGTQGRLPTKAMR